MYTGQVVLFGGENASGALADTWTWNGSTWAQQSPAASPSPRAYAAMPVPIGGDVVLFGGENGGTPLGDTWTWDGSTWAQQSPKKSPSPRYGAAMASGLGISQIDLFGGTGRGGPDGDTWTWHPAGQAATYTRVVPQPGKVAACGQVVTLNAFVRTPAGAPAAGVASFYEGTPGGQHKLLWTVFLDPKYGYNPGSLRPSCHRSYHFYVIYPGGINWAPSMSPAITVKVLCGKPHSE